MRRHISRLPAMLLCLLSFSVSLVAADTEGKAPDSSSAPASAPKTESTPVNVVRVPAKKDQMVYKMLPLVGVSYATLDQICRPWLSEGGILTYEKSRDSILVYDTPEVILKIAKFMSETAVGSDDSYNIRIEVDYIGGGANSDLGLNVTVDSGTASKRGIGFKWENGKLVRPKSVDINPVAKTGKTSSLNSMMIVTANGEPATLWVGRTQLDPSWLRAQKLIPNIIVITPNNTLVIQGTDTDFKWADIGSKLLVTPSYNSRTGNVTLELCPALTYLDGKKKEQYVKVESLSTKVVVREGQRFYLGGMISGKKNEYVNIFGPDFYSNTSDNRVLDIYVTCRAMKPGDPRNSRPTSNIPGFNR